MSPNLTVGVAAVLGTLAVALLLVGVGRLADKRRGLSTEESRQSGLVLCSDVERRVVRRVY